MSIQSSGDKLVKSVGSIKLGKLKTSQWNIIFIYCTFMHGSSSSSNKEIKRFSYIKEKCIVLFALNLLDLSDDYFHKAKWGKNAG